jgi:hypothetical protein
MEPFSFKKLSGEPIIVGTISAQFDLGHDAPVVIKQLQALLDESEEPLYDIADIREVKISFSDLVVALAIATKGEMGVLHHPKLRRFIAVTTNDLTRFGVAALKQAQYGNLSVDVFGSIEEALASVRREIQQEAALIKSPVA